MRRRGNKILLTTKGRERTTAHTVLDHLGEYKPPKVQRREGAMDFMKYPSRVGSTLIQRTNYLGK